MSPEEFSELINRLFVDEKGQRRLISVDLTIRAGEDAFTLVNADVSANMTLARIFQQYYAEIKEADKDESADTPRTNPGVQRIEHITHGKTEYIVFHFKDDSFQVQKTTGDVLPPGQVLFNTIVKKYKEQLHREE